MSCTCSNEVSVTHFYSEGNSQQGSDGFFLISIITSAVPYWTNVPPGQEVSDIHEYVTFKPLRICHKGVFLRQPTHSSVRLINVFALEYDSSITIYYKNYLFFLCQCCHALSI